MKGNLVSLSAAWLLAGLMGSTTATAQNVVINELNLVVGPETGQFVELYGAPGTARGPRRHIVWNDICHFSIFNATFRKI